MSPSPPVPVTAIWLRRTGTDLHVLAEVNGKWRKIITEHAEGPMSHIAEARGFESRPVDDL